MIREAELIGKIKSMGGQIYIVGGWVRDRLLDRPSHDKDYVVCGLSEDGITAAFDTERVGHAFPVFLIDVDGASCELSLARTEEKTSRGYRGFKVSFSPSITIEEDLYRRDTTMNSMALSLPDMTLIDPYNGAEDIRRKTIRATSLHFREDPVRSLRAARQSSQLDFSIDGETVRLMASTKDELMSEPGERIFSELNKALSSARPYRFFEALHDAGLLCAVFNDTASYDSFAEAVCALKRAAEICDAPHVRFAAFTLGLAGSYVNSREAAGCVRPSLPKAWSRLIRFLDSDYSRIIEANSAYEIICILKRIKRLSLDVEDISAVITALTGASPEFLKNHQFWEHSIEQARSELNIPDYVAPAKRGEWLNVMTAEKLNKRIKR